MIRFTSDRAVLSYRRFWHQSIFVVSVGTVLYIAFVVHHVKTEFHPMLRAKSVRILNSSDDVGEVIQSDWNTAFTSLCWSNSGSNEGRIGADARGQCSRNCIAVPRPHLYFWSEYPASGCNLIPPKNSYRKLILADFGLVVGEIRTLYGVGESNFNIKCRSPANISEIHGKIKQNHTWRGVFWMRQNGLGPIKFYPSSLLNLKLLDCSIQEFVGLETTAASLVDRLLSYASCVYHLSPLKISDPSIDGGSGKSQPSGDYKPALKAVLYLGLGLSLSFYVFWCTQFGSKLNLKWSIFCLFGCFCSIAYGTALLLECSLKVR